MQEILDILNALSQIRINEMDMADQAKYFSAMAEFCEKLKPIIAKYAADLPKSATFLMKM
jgi:hypothetical protein